MTYALHGIETVTTVAGPRPVKEVASGIVGLVGLAPIHHVDPAAAPPAPNKLAALVTPRHDAKMGPVLAGYDIPTALREHRYEKGGTVVAINVFDPAVHKIDVAEATFPIADGKLQLPHGDLISAVVKKIADPDVTMTSPADYTIDRITGLISVTAGGQLVGQATAKVAYVRANPAAVDAEDIIGAVSVAGIRSGAKAFLDSQSKFGYKPRLLIAPSFSGDASVRSELADLASKLRAFAICDVPAGTSLEDAIEGRLPSGTVDLQSTNGRVVFVYPQYYVPVPGGRELVPFSPGYAACVARTDREVGFHKSPSNRTLERVSGLEVDLTVSLDDATADVQRLNAAGITTIYSGGEKGYRVFGNRSAAFPGNEGIMSFVSAQRTVDMVSEAIEGACFEYLDGVIGPALIQSVLADVNAYVRQLITRGALISGSYVAYRPEDNPTEDLQTGKIKFFRADCPPPPAEHITWLHVVDTTLLANIFGG